MYIKISVKNKIAALQDDTLIINGNSDYVIKFDFDAEWEPYETKTARFVTARGYTDVVFSGDEVAVPVITDAISVSVGVYAGNLRTTTPAVIFCRRCITDGSGSPVDPPDDVYNQIMELIQGLGTPDADAIAAAVADYISKNPIKETDPTVAEWAKAKDKPEYTADEVGAIAKAELQSAIDTALAQAKASGEFDGADGAPGKDGANGQPGAPGSPGKDGVTPTIGDNGNWYIGDTDTGKPSRGENGDTGPAGPDGTPGAAGTDGKSAYQYAIECGYTGTEAEFADKMAQEMPEKLPNPQALTFTGAVTGSYDGSAALTVNIPEGGGGGETFTGQWEELVNHTVTADEATAVSITFTQANYPKINGHKTLLVEIKKPSAVSTPWFTVKAGSIEVLNAVTNSWNYWRGAATVHNGHWMQKCQNGTNANNVDLLSPSYVFNNSATLGVRNKAYVNYTSLEISSYMKFFEEGTTIKIYGGK